MAISLPSQFARDSECARPEWAFFLVFFFVNIDPNNIST